MSLKKLLPVIMAMAVAYPATNNARPWLASDFTPISDKEKERLKNERLKAKGFKEFWIHGECILALNEKAAYKKYKKKLT